MASVLYFLVFLCMIEFKVGSLSKRRFEWNLVESRYLELTYFKSFYYLVSFVLGSLWL